jgi:hypothetical protein
MKGKTNTISFLSLQNNKHILFDLFYVIPPLRHTCVKYTDQKTN